MSRVRPPENIEIASLKKKQRTVFDPMFAGQGTPWEDRATHGTVGAFFKTCAKSMSSPARLMASIRRPETTNDARAFLIGICSIWGLTAIVHFAYFVWKETEREPATYIGLNTMHTVLLGAATIAWAGGGMYFLFKIYNIIYGRLTAQEKDSVLLPDVLLYNVNAYALGPSLLAIIPFAGPPIALLWIFMNFIAAGASRLRLRIAAAIIDAVISMLAVIAIAGGVYLVGEKLILEKVADFHAVDRQEPIDVPKTPAASRTPGAS